MTTCVITGYGINADLELAEAFRQAGSKVERVHINDLIAQPDRLQAYRIIGFPGGFSFGDHLGSGLVFAGLFKRHLKPALDDFVAAGGLILGICNGFQVLVKMGVLPNFDGNWGPTVSLIHNENGTFEDSWVRVAEEPDSRCVWTTGMGELDLPIRNGEGRFITASPAIYDRLVADRLIALTYSGRNPNGSQGSVAGITDTTGRILGLMPHPEAYLYPENHPEWLRGDGLTLFRNGVAEARN
jgi:phosphoribosylformylglycinamidine synthase subunit PurQ / glutaminase